MTAATQTRRQGSAAATCPCTPAASKSTARRNRSWSHLATAGSAVASGPQTGSPEVLRRQPDATGAVPEAAEQASFPGVPSTSQAGTGPLGGSPEDTASGLPDTVPPAGTSWVVEDAAEPAAGQVRKGELLATLEGAACAAADAELDRLGLTTRGCPYIATLFAYLRSQSAGRLDGLLGQIVPGGAGATLAQAAAAVVSQVRGATARWAETGEVGGLPAGIPSSAVLSALGAGSLAGGLSGLAGLGAGLFFKRGASGSPSGAAGLASGAAGAAATRARLGAGRTLDGGVRGRMEGAFGASFAGVRLHTGARAAALSSELGARAFAVGTDVAFGAGEYRPGTPVGDALLAHELAHVLQQRSAGPTIAPSGAGGGALETDADHSAVGAVARLWMGLRGGLKSLPATALPRLKSGLRLQRCGCKKSDFPVPTGKVPESPPNFDCSSVTPTTLKEVRKNGSNTLGFTGAKGGATKVTESTSFSDRCTLELNELPAFKLDPYVYTQAGTYEDGTETRKKGGCRKKTLVKKLEITQAVADKIKEGEMEHCEDHKRAWALSTGRYIPVYRELEKGYCAENSTCEAERKAWFLSRTGIAWDDRGTVAKCLRRKSGERDSSPNYWHTLIIRAGKKAKYDKKCTTVVYTPTVSDLGEVGVHSTKDLVKGCGE